jgi:FKBP-type peptidyl-prolyl cis-trans isomerase
MKPARSLKIKDIRTGDGIEVRQNDIVHFHCSCRLSKGEIVFTTQGKAPFQVRVGGRNAYVALDQGLLGMRVGGLRQIKVPPNLTYYERATFPEVPPTAILIYEIELLRIVDEWHNTPPG